MHLLQIEFENEHANQAYANSDYYVFYSYADQDSLSIVISQNPSRDNIVAEGLSHDEVEQWFKCEYQEHCMDTAEEVRRQDFSFKQGEVSTMGRKF